MTNLAPGTLDYTYHVPSLPIWRTSIRIFETHIEWLHTFCENGGVLVHISPTSRFAVKPTRPSPSVKETRKLLCHSDLRPNPPRSPTSTKIHNPSSSASFVLAWSLRSIPGSPRSFMVFSSRRVESCWDEGHQVTFRKFNTQAAFWCWQQGLSILWQSIAHILNQILL